MIIFLLASANAFGQDIKTTDFFDKAKQFDFSDLLTLDKFQIENGTETVKRSQPLGFISENYQRFYIHFSSVIQNPDDPYQYFVYGKTRVKNNICEFQSTLTITAARTYDVGDVANLKLYSGGVQFFRRP